MSVCGYYAAVWVFSGRYVVVVVVVVVVLMAKIL
jgi:hypothetical protein